MIGHRNGRLIHCFAAGTVLGDYSTGALVGYASSSSSYYYENCFWDITINPTINGIGNVTDPSTIIATSTSQMHSQSNFTSKGWDFLGEFTNGENDIWRMCVDGVDYPRLSWEFAKTGDFACPDGVEMDDLESLAMNWLTTAEVAPDTFDYACDANGDELINFEDYSILADNWLVGAE